MLAETEGEHTFETEEDGFEFLKWNAPKAMMQAGCQSTLNLTEPQTNVDMGDFDCLLLFS